MNRTDSISKPHQYTDSLPKLSVLMLHNRYQYNGGEDISTAQETHMLRTMGQKIDLIEWSNDRIQSFSKAQKANLFFSSSWNHKSAAWATATLEACRPDVLHVQNFFPLLSPSVHQSAQALAVPTVQHLRNFRLGCLSPYLFRKGKVCEDCVGTNPWRGVVHRCYRNSIPASLSVWQMVVSNRLNHTWDRYIDAFIAPSQFAANKLIEMGLPDCSMHVKPDIIQDPFPDSSPPLLPDLPTFLYTGRLSPEKGILTLLKAWLRLNQPEWILNIVGDGPQQPLLQDFCHSHDLRNVNFLGHKALPQVLKAMQTSTAVIVPSQWYETFGRVAIEAHACGRIALVSDLGAIAELVQENVTGFKIPPDNVDAWKERIEWCAHNPIQLAKMGQSARAVYKEKFTPEANYLQLMSIYQHVLK